MNFIVEIKFELPLDKELSDLRSYLTLYLDLTKKTIKFQVP